MFGHDWVDAHGRIVDKRVTHTYQDNNWPVNKHEYVVEVSADGKQPFRCVLHDPLVEIDWAGPSVGETVMVHADFDRQKAKWDTADKKFSAKWRLGDTKEQKDAVKARFEANAQAAPGQHERDRWAGTAAEGTGFEEHMDPELAELIELEAKENAAGGSAAPAASAAPAGNAQSRLQELQQLKTAGLISDAEFAEKRKAILEEL